MRRSARQTGRVRLSRKKPPEAAFRPGDEWDPGNPRNKERTRAGQRELRARLLQWDPIGVADVPEAQDEYDCMIGPLLRKLHKGESAEAITAWLSSEQRDHFGLTPDKQADGRLASDLVHWWNTTTSS